MQSCQPAVAAPPPIDSAGPHRPVTLQDLTEIEIYGSVFFNNSAIVGGAQWVNRAANMVQYQGNFTLNLAESVSSASF